MTLAPLALAAALAAAAGGAGDGWRIAVMLAEADLEYPAQDLRLQCERGSGEVRLAFRSDAAVREAAVASGAAKEAARLVADPETGELVLTLAIDSPVLLAFETSGAVSVQLDTRTLAPPPAPAELARRFISACVARAQPRYRSSGGS